MNDYHAEHLRPDGPGSNRSDVLWEGNVITNGRVGDPVKARIVECEGAFIDPFNKLGPGLKFQTWNERNREWHATSPHTINAASLAMALAEAHKPTT